MHSWYVLHVLSGHEKKVKTAIEENCGAKGIEGLIEEVILPVENVSEVKKGKQKIVEKKLWPGYLLIKMTLTDESWMFVKNTESVINFLGDSSPTPLTDLEVEDILNDLKNKETTIVQRHQFEVGDTVKIVDGVFENFSGTVLEVFHDKGTLSVMVSIFGRDTRVDDLEFWQVEAVSEEAQNP